MLPRSDVLVAGFISPDGSLDSEDPGIRDLELEVRSTEASLDRGPEPLLEPRAAFGIPERLLTLLAEFCLDTLI